MDWNNKVPKLLAGEELKNKLTDLPVYDDEVRSMDAATRLIQLTDLYKIYYPNMMSMEIYSRLYLAMMMSLKKKNTTLATLQQKENSLGMKNKEYRGIIGGSDSSTIIGCSGIGKSSAIAKAVELATGDKLIENTEPYMKIIPILQVQCPFDASPKGMLLEILRMVDKHLESSYYRSGTRTGVTTDTLIGLTSQVCLNHVGVLVIDEIQNVIKHRNGKLLVGVLMQLINCSGVSVVNVGTPECISFFESETQLARRSIGLKYDVLPLDEYFVELCHLLFQYQYTRKKTEITDVIINWLYEHSGGVIANVISIIHDAQEIAIFNGTEIMNMENLNNAYDKRMGMLHAKIAANMTKKASTMVKKKKGTGEIRTAGTIVNNFNIEDIIAGALGSKEDVVKVLRQYIPVEEVAIQ